MGSCLRRRSGRWPTRCLQTRPGTCSSCWRSTASLARATALAIAQGMTRAIAQGMTRAIAQGMTRAIAQGMTRAIALAISSRDTSSATETRLEALELAANLAKAGRAGASSRWSADQNGDGHSTGHSRGLRPRDAQTETETTSRARAPARPREAGWTPSQVLDRQPRRRGPAPNTRTPAEVQAAAHRPGGPAEDVHGWAAKARAGITSPDDPSPGDRQDPLPDPAAPPAEQDPPEPAAAPEETEADDIPF